MLWADSFTQAQLSLDKFFLNLTSTISGVPQAPTAFASRCTPPQVYNPLIDYSAAAAPPAKQCSYSQSVRQLVIKFSLSSSSFIASCDQLTTSYMSVIKSVSAATAYEFYPLDVRCDNPPVINTQLFQPISPFDSLRFHQLSLISSFSIL